METTSESATSNAKSIETSTSNDTNLKEEHTTQTIPPKGDWTPILMFLGVIFCTLCVIVLGYIHGNMHLLTTLKNAANS